MKLVNPDGSWFESGDDPVLEQETITSVEPADPDDPDAGDVVTRASGWYQDPNGWWKNPDRPGEATPKDEA